MRLSIQIKGAQLKRKGLENLRREIPIIAAQRIYDCLKRARDELKRAGKRVTYPIAWDSERQRRAYFASEGFGGGIPSRRTGEYQRGWMIRRNPGGGNVQVGYSLINPVKHARHVAGSAYGEGQSSIHRGRWVLVRDVLEKHVARLPKTVEEHIAMVARREGLS